MCCSTAALGHFCGLQYIFGEILHCYWSIWESPARTSGRKRKRGSISKKVLVYNGKHCFSMQGITVISLDDMHASSVPLLGSAFQVWLVALGSLQTHPLGEILAVGSLSMNIVVQGFMLAHKPRSPLTEIISLMASAGTGILLLHA
jgi:hypothetical protein